MLGIKWYHQVWNDDVRWTTEQPKPTFQVSTIVQARHFSVWPHCTNATDVKKKWNRCQEDLNSFPLENWRRTCTTKMKTIQQDLKSN